MWEFAWRWIDRTISLSTNERNALNVEFILIPRIAKDVGQIFCAENIQFRVWLRFWFSEFIIHSVPSQAIILCETSLFAARGKESLSLSSLILHLHFEQCRPQKRLLLSPESSAGRFVWIDNMSGRDHRLKVCVRPFVQSSLSGLSVSSVSLCKFSLLPLKQKINELTWAYK